jgi:hypothetical protein
MGILKNIQLTISSKHRLRALLFLCGISNLAGCTSPQPPKSEYPSREVPEERDPSDPLLTEGERVYLPTLNGQWLHYSQISTCVEIGSSLEQLNRSLYLVSVEQLEHGGLIESWRACDIDLTPVLTVQARVTQSVKDSVYPIVSDRGQTAGLYAEQVYLSGPIAELWGVNMDHSSIDPFPTEASDPRIFDSDGDGNPGVTLLVGSACEAYIIQRRLSQYAGHFVQPDRIEGEAISVTEQLVADASQAICKTPYQTRSNPSGSRFTRLRVDGRGGAINLDLDEDGTVTCAEVVSRREVLLESSFEVLEVDDASCR